MAWRPKAIGTLRALRWAGWRVLQAALVLAVVGAGAHYLTGFDVADAADPDRSMASEGSSVGAAATINHSLVEDEFIALLNDERRDRDLQPVRESDRLGTLARDHAENMATHGYVGHDEPGPGGTIEERYRDAGLLPECRLSTGTGRYYPGAENAYGGNSVDPVAGAERRVATHLFEAWMGSDGHRRAMLVASADEAGLALAVSDGKIYASLNLC